MECQSASIDPSDNAESEMSLLSDLIFLTTLILNIQNKN